MCGIAGFWNKNKRHADHEALTRMTDSLLHRGPDSGGYWVADDLGLGHRRLSILDLSAHANQPFVSPCNNYMLVFNGEIFNYQDFYPELRNKGYQFHTSSDTEVLLYLLIEYGVEVLPRLNGFFAFALWNDERRELLLVRDRYGVKPLFYTNSTEFMAFASEPKAIFSLGVEKNISEENLDEQFFYRHVSGENTIFEGIQRVLPGHWQLWSDGVVLKQSQRWYHLGEESKKYGLISDPKSWYEELFYDSVKLRMISDVPVGTMLSGGLDSTSILYAQHKMGYGDLSSWNVRFSGFAKDESHLAKRLSDEYGVKYHGCSFIGDDLVGFLKKSILITDEPLMHMTDSVLLGLSQQAKKKVSVLLTGEGADEVMGGYVRHKVFGSDMRYSLLKFLQYVPAKWIKKERILKMKRYLAFSNSEFQQLTNANELFIQDLQALGLGSLNVLPAYRIKMLEEAKQYHPKNKLRQLLYLEHFTHLVSLNDKNDRTTMGASIECREPFLDYRLVTGIASLPDSYFSTKGKGKLLSMETIGRKLPDYIQNHEKVGMAIPWMKYILEIPEFRDHLEDMHKSPLFEMSWLNFLDVKSIVDAFKTDPATHNSSIRSLFFLSYWYKIQFSS